jgi:hypothetical protein
MTPLRTFFTSLVSLSLTCLTLVSATTGHADTRPTRSECIIGFRLDWSQVKADRHEVHNALSLGPEGMQKIEARPAIKQSLDGTRLYFQFERNCETKQDLAAGAIAFWRSKGLDLPRFERIEEPIVPSPETIEVWGPAWRDEPERARGAPK